MSPLSRVLLLLLAVAPLAACNPPVPRMERVVVAWPSGRALP